MPALVVAQQQRRLSLGKPAVAPRQHGDERPVEIAAHVGQQIFVALGRVLIEPAVKDALRHQAGQPVGQDVRRDAELRLNVVVAAVAEESPRGRP